MSSDLQSVVISQKKDGSWQAVHIPSQKIAHGLTKIEAEDEMRRLIGMNDSGEFVESKTSPAFSGMGYDIAVYLEGPVSDMLSLHSGFARLDTYADNIAHVRLGGGCKGCPSSMMTLVNGVKRDLQEKFGEDVVADVMPVLE